MITFAIDLVVIMILAFFVWSGHRKGLILSAITLVIFFVSVMIGGSVASQNVENAAGFFDELLSWVGDEATENAISELDVPRDNMTDSQTRQVSDAAFRYLGVHSKASPYLAGVTTGVYRDLGGTLYQSVSYVFIRAVTWVALFFTGFLIANLILSIIINFLFAMFELPVLRLLDSIGGIVIGFVTGLMVMFLVGMGLRYMGIIIPDGLLEGTHFLKMFIDGTPFGSLITISAG